MLSKSLLLIKSPEICRVASWRRKVSKSAAGVSGEGAGGLDDGGSDDVFEAVGGVAGQRGVSAATAQVLAVRPLHVDVPLLLLAAAASLGATLGDART